MPKAPVGLPVDLCKVPIVPSSASCMLSCHNAPRIQLHNDNIHLFNNLPSHFFAHNVFGFAAHRELPTMHPIEFSCVSCPRASAPSAPQSRTCVFQLLNPAVRLFVKQASLPLPPCHRDTYTCFCAVGMRQTVNRRPFAEPIAIGSPPERPAAPTPLPVRLRTPHLHVSHGAATARSERLALRLH